MNNLLKIAFLLLLLNIFYSCQSTTKTTASNLDTTNTSVVPNKNNSLLGTWTYTLNIRPSNLENEDILNPSKEKVPLDNPEGVKQSEFSLTIDKEHIYLAGNEIECNSCDKRYILEANKIVFPAKNSSPTCTELYCPSDYELKAIDNKGKIIYLFRDMNYKIEGNKLELSNESGNKLVLTKVI